MRKGFVFWIVFVLIGALTVVGGKFTLTPSVAHSAAPAMSPACQALNNPAYDSGAAYLGGVLPGSLEIWAGETIVVEAVGGESGATRIQLLFDGAEVASRDFPGALVYSVPQTQTVLIGWTVDESGAYWTVGCFANPQPCSVQLTVDAVVGRFTQDTPLYWTPDKLLEPRLSLSAGKTAWVLGQNEAGDYYQIMWVCQLLWVPVDTIGPNVGDPVWQGAPLPTGVVQ